MHQVSDQYDRRQNNNMGVSCLTISFSLSAVRTQQRTSTLDVDTLQRSKVDATFVMYTVLPCRLAALLLVL